LPIADPRQLAGALAGLAFRERRIVELHYGIGEARPLSLGQIGRRFGISAERVRQIETRALSRLATSKGNSAVDAGKKPGPRSTSLPANALQAWALLLLRRRPAHGYELGKRLHQAGVHVSGDRLYRLLREFEQRGLVRSDWVGGGPGPERRVYRLTRKGSRQLRDEVQALRPLFDALGDFFEQYAHASGSGQVKTAKPSATQRKTSLRT
jgi:DNA-binding PadR family transcriptional regulator